MSQSIGTVVLSTGGAVDPLAANVVFQTNNVSATGTAIACNVGTFTINTVTPTTQSSITGERTFYAHPSLRTILNPSAGANTNQTGASTQAIALGAGDFCIETWINPIIWESNGKSMTIWSSILSNSDTPLGLLLDIDNAGSILEMWNSTATSAVALGRISTATTFIGQWANIAVVRASGVITVYVNGVSAFSFANTTNFSTARVFNFGAGGYASNTDFSNYRAFTACFGPIRFTVGAARYTANYQVNPLPYGYSLGTATVTDPNISNLVVNLRDDGNVIYDMKSQLLIQNGVGTTATAQVGTLSYNFLGVASQYALINATLSGAAPVPGGGPSGVVSFGIGSTTSSTKDFTIEMWVNPGTQTGASPRLAGSSSQIATSAAVGVWNLCYAHSTNGGTASPTFSLFVGFTGTTTTAQIISTVCPAGSWYHVRIVRHFAVYYMFINGVLQTTTVTNSTNAFCTTPGSGLVIGGSINAASAFVGLINNFTIWSKALSTTTFTPSTTQIQDLLLVGG